MLHREKITRILTQARQIDANCEMFGADHHQYRLNPPVPESFVREVEEACGFTLPSDYRRFITQVGDGGAGPDYGIDPFRNFWKEGYFQEDRFAEAHRQRYRRSLTRPFAPRPMTPEDQADSATGNPSHYAAHPERYFIIDPPEKEEEEEGGWWLTGGFLTLGTRGCQWAYGIALNGKHRGRVFTTDNEGGYLLEAYSFEEFYRRWLEWLADTESFRQALKQWQGRFRR